MDAGPSNAGSNAHLLKELSELLEGYPTIHFTTSKNLEAAAQQLRNQHQGEYLVCTGVSPDTFEKLATDRDSVLYHARLLYIYSLRTLRVKIEVSSAYHIAVDTFRALVVKKLVQMGADDNICFRGSRVAYMQNVAKQPEGSWGPDSKTYKTCVLEASISESNPRPAFNIDAGHGLLASRASRAIDIDARLWLETPDSPDAHVRQVITMTLARSVPDIVFRKWELSDYPQERETQEARPDPPQAQITQEVHVCLADNVPLVSGSLALSFTQLFERPPGPDTLETEHIVFTPRDLTGLASKVWRRQGLISTEKEEELMATVEEQEVAAV